MGISDKNLIGKDRIRELIPQRDPIVMIDALIFSDETRTVSSFEVDKNNIFVSDGYLSESGMIENIAQTAAARVGYIAMQRSAAIPIGFIAGIKDLKIYSLPKISSVLITEIVIENTVMGMTIISGKTVCEDKILVTCEMKIFINPEINSQEVALK